MGSSVRAVLLDVDGTAGAPCVGVLSGGIGRDEALSAGAVAVHAGPDDPLTHLDEVLSDREEQHA